MTNYSSIVPVQRWGVLVLAATVSLCVSPRSSASDDGDFEYWPKVSFLVPIDEQWKVKVEERLTFGDEARRLDDIQADLGLYYLGLADWFTVGFGYKETFEKDGDDWLLEHRPLVNLIVKGRPCGLTVVSRSRFEYRMPEEDDDVWRYRNKVLIAPEPLLSSTKILPYLAEEIFIRFDDEDFNQHRLQGGLFLPLHEQIRLELFYCWKLDEQEDNSWHDTNIVGSYLYFLF